MVERTRYPALTVLAAAAAIVVLTGVGFVVAASEATTNKETDGSCQTSEEGCGLSVTKKGKLLMYHYASAESTQDEARAIVSLSEEELVLMIPPSPDDNDDFNTVAVTAAEQTKGRGTNGRKWMGARGNAFVTICIRQKDWRATSLPMTLLPVKIGIVVAQQVSKLLAAACQQQGKPATAADAVTIKWPNDVLVDGQKIAGVLIESTGEWFMIGIGINVQHAPTVPIEGPNHGRPSTCIQCHCPADITDNNASPNPDYYVDMAKELGVAMAADLSEWLAGSSDEWDANKEQTHILQQWRSFVDWDMQLVLRDSSDKQPVLPVDIEPDGRLRVQGADGTQRLVVSDYFL